MSTVADLDSGPDAVRRRELASFLRSRRERITPDQVGLPHTRRRRTPGLRREEVAQLAGVGVTWYTWLEQGRDIRASDGVLDAIARTLRLDPHESAHLFTLAGIPARPAVRDRDAIPAGVHALLAKLEPYPVVVQNARTDILAHNRAYEWLLGVDELPFEERNLLLQCFAKRRWRSRMPDWEQNKARTVAEFRSAMAGHVAEPSWKSLVNRLRGESAEFEALWTEHDVRPPVNWTKRFLHPDAGLLCFDATYLWLSRTPEIRMTTYTPSNEQTEAKLPTPS
ncbi:transcriptional regulator with XRE-family HTH domain [Saccharomonospora amisosensis]|uniref:Transcriptional regulator with XRE-family HTH domain n=1 Tax=Saccharomonospora amisosensis TaxID=1128677 RepID=A0A7X5UUM3_9PSEU|nr:helix-turn-helix domain-containing protein [Saccharomonospora amisosensis]NIJ14493.1 transcriptional regulator with XRE-family HTH domain [Saccharomonospora amisosensis]